MNLQIKLDQNAFQETGDAVYEYVNDEDLEYDN